MPRHPRTVFPGVPHHITQRGNRRDDVFFSDDDRLRYLDWLKDYCQKHGVEILAYCLMTNHVHVVAIPQTEDGLQRVFRPLHMRHAQWINRSQGWNGHLWQGRFFSSPLDDAYLWAAIRYVERNPVRATMVKQAEDYPWSSAAAHCQKIRDPLLSHRPDWLKRLRQIDDWRSWLAEDDAVETLDTLRQHANRGLPCGSPEFVERLEALSGRSLRFRPRGRPISREDKEDPPTKG